MNIPVELIKSVINHGNKNVINNLHELDAEDDTEKIFAVLGYKRGVEKMVGALEKVVKEYEPTDTGKTTV